MKNVLITGASGNVGLPLIKFLSLSNKVNVIAGVRDIEKSKNIEGWEKVSRIKFDFLEPGTYLEALKMCDILFLLRPPQISGVKKYFKPLIDLAILQKIEHIVFLSVQGVENSNWTPHYKIEKLILKSELPYTFLRPAYFMQNFTTNLREDLVKHNLVFLPAGDSCFTLIDTIDIGKVAAQVINDYLHHKNKAYDLTAKDKLTFKEMTEILSRVLERNIEYQSPSIFRFFIEKSNEKMPFQLIMIMILLHYLPRFNKSPEISPWVKEITEQDPLTFSQFIRENVKLLSL